MPVIFDPDLAHCYFYGCIRPPRRVPFAPELDHRDFLLLTDKLWRRGATWRFLGPDFFSVPNLTRQRRSGARLVLFGGFFLELEEQFPSFLTEFESVLAQIHWLEVSAHLRATRTGAFDFTWTRRDDVPSSPWNFVGLRHIPLPRPDDRTTPEATPNTLAVDLGAGINPGKGAAGLALGNPVETFRRLPGTRSVRVAGGLERLDHGPVVVWARGGLIEQIGVGAGYAGEVLATGVRIGNTLGDVRSALGRVFEDELDALVVEGVPGLALETDTWAGEPGREALEENWGVAITEFHVFRPDGADVRGGERQLMAGTPSPHDSDTATAAAQFLSAFEAVFDSDWSYTREQLGVDDHARASGEAQLARIFGEQPQAHGGTFVHPTPDDAPDRNWGNYELLLKAYRALKRSLEGAPKNPDAGEQKGHSR
jgi:hypothetical protein